MVVNSVAGYSGLYGRLLSGLGYGLGNCSLEAQNRIAKADQLAQAHHIPDPYQGLGPVYKYTPNNLVVESMDKVTLRMERVMSLLDQTDVFCENYSFDDKDIIDHLELWDQHNMTTSEWMAWKDPQVNKSNAGN